MRSTVIAYTFLLGAVSAAPALANMCVADSGRRCATGMPVDGYCMCGNAARPKKAQSQSTSDTSAARPRQAD
jgi:hypothetical protein